MPSVLIFESDQKFANELKSKLTQLSCDVSVVADANVGLQRAAESLPDLILLCTELPGMNGFSVCNRLKRDSKLRKVPVIIMSAEASEETFEQHRNLPKKRAQDYVHKPVSFDDLKKHIHSLMPLPGGTEDKNPRSQNDAELLIEEEAIELDEIDELVVDDELVSDDGSQQAASPPNATTQEEELKVDLSSKANLAPPPAEGIPDAATKNFPKTLDADEDVDQLTEDAFGTLLSEDGGQQLADSSPSDTSKASESLPDPKPSITEQDARLVHSSLPPLPPSRRSPAPPGPPAGAPEPRRAFLLNDAANQNEALGAAEERIADLEKALSSAGDKDAKLEALYQQLDEANARLSSGTGRAKEILDLREALNKKDKELLDLRDQLTRKDKELLSARDASLVLERRQAENEEAAIEQDKKSSALERAKEAALQDREQANKRADDYKRKAEKSLENVQATASELDAVRQQFESLSLAKNEASAQLDELNSLVASHTTTIEQRATELEASQQEISKLGTELEARQDQLNTLEGKHQELQERIISLEKELTQTQSEASETSAEREKLSVAVAESVTSLGDILSRLQSIS